jgi:hypothetical protein
VIGGARHRLRRRCGVSGKRTRTRSCDGGTPVSDVHVDSESASLDSEALPDSELWQRAEWATHVSDPHLRHRCANSASRLVYRAFSRTKKKYNAFGRIKAQYKMSFFRGTGIHYTMSGR